MTSRGFTLIEMLVALIILAIALSAASRSAQMAIQNSGDLRLRLLAGWVADNRLALRQATPGLPPLGRQEGDEQMGRETFHWREDVVATPNNQFLRLDIEVMRPGESAPLARLSGYLVGQ